MGTRDCGVVIGTRASKWASRTKRLSDVLGVSLEGDIDKISRVVRDDVRLLGDSPREVAAFWQDVGEVSESQAFQWGGWPRTDASRQTSTCQGSMRLE